jgi:hypothetical protein
MIKNIIDLLNINEFYGVSADIDIAKGKYKYPATWKELKQLLKRKLKSKK